LSEEKKKEVVIKLVERVGELRGGLEVAKEAGKFCYRRRMTGEKESVADLSGKEAESSHLLLQYLISSNFDAQSEEYSTLEKKVLEALKQGGEIAANAGRTGRSEAASRMYVVSREKVLTTSLNNIYNYLPSSSALRPTTLLTLLSLLAITGELSTLNLTPAIITSALSQWQISESEKINFLVSAADIYQSAGQLDKASDLSIIALQQSVEKKVVEKAVVLAIAVEDRFDLDAVLKVQGVRDQVDGKLKEVVGLFTDVDEVEAVAKGQEWVRANSSFIEGFCEWMILHQYERS